MGILGQGRIDKKDLFLLGDEGGKIGGELMARIGLDLG
jgi:hypothetical protein